VSFKTLINYLIKLLLFNFLLIQYVYERVFLYYHSLFEASAKVELLFFLNKLYFVKIYYFKRTYGGR